MPESSGEKTEQATAKRRQEARDKGTVVRSQDLVGSVGTIALLLALPAAGASMGQGAVDAFRGAMHSLSGVPTPDSIAAAAGRAASPMLGGLALLLAVAVGAAFLANVGQVGFKVSPEALTPNLSKLNPMSGLQRLLSKQGLVDTAKGTVKTMLFGYLAYGVIRDAWPDLMALGQAAPGAAFDTVAGILRGVALRVVPAWLVLSAVDYGVQAKRVADSLKMTKDEVKREHKEAQVSPEVLRERAKRQRKMAQGGMMQAVKTADVVVTNPTHYAVAIHYERDKHAAPVIVAKGVDLLAARIREEAKAARVPLVPNPPLARALYRQCEIGDPVPHDLFRAVAEVLAYVYRTLRKVQA